MQPLFFWVLLLLGCLSGTAEADAGSGASGTKSAKAPSPSKVPSAPQTHHYTFNAEWIWANPDGVKARPVISFNGSFPLPILEVNKGDRIVLTLINSLVNASTSLHFHGLYQNGTTHMDGPEGVNQCPIPPGSSLTYNFTTVQHGTFWYHSHSGGQYADGLRGMLVVHDPEVEAKYKYDEEVWLTVSDWYHDTSDVLQKKQLSRYNPTGAEPVPQNLLFNDTQNTTMQVEPDKTYLVRIVNMGVMVSQYIFIEDHDVEIVEADGVYMKPAKASMLYLTVGQRVSILLKTKKNVTSNFCIVQSLDVEMLDVVPEDLEVTRVNYLQYDPLLPNPKPKKSSLDIDSYEPFEDFNLVPIDPAPLLPEADHVVRLRLHMDNLGDGINYAFFNDYTFVAAKVPTLLTALSAPEDVVMDERIYGVNTNSILLQKGEVVDFVIDNEDGNKHPLHMHGHKYQVLVKSPPYEEPTSFSYDNASEFPAYPLMRDTVMVNTYGNVVLRFVADNPGVWFFHCHLDFHLEQGLAVLLVEAPDEIRKSIAYKDLPEDFMEICRAQDIPTRGNAAGNDQDWLDLSGSNLQPDPLPDGFTTKGYIALALCIAAALWGLYAIVQFGLDDVNHTWEDRVVGEKVVIEGLLEKLSAECQKDNVREKKRQEMAGMIQELQELRGSFDQV